MENISHAAFFLSDSPLMQKLRAQSELLAQTDVPVLIVGEKGSGKSLVASLIHQLSVRSGFKLLRVRCAALPETVLRAEIFGNAASTRPGKAAPLGGFTAGEKGTIFLDEIGALPLDLQERLSQCLQSQETHRSAYQDAAPAAVRVLAGSSVNPDRALEEKRLREDLYYRLSAFTVCVPSLRQRKEEIPLLLRYFMHQLSQHYRMPSREFSAATLEACESYGWPGNLAEMETFVKRYLVAGERQSPRGGTAAAFEPGGGPISPRQLHSASASDRAPAALEPARIESLKALIQGIKSEAEQNAIGAALQRTGWNRKAAARLLSVSYRTLLYKIDQYQMRAPESLMASSVGEFSLYGREQKDEKTH
jgi:DNA-binding NtrC family response regulator